MPAKKCNGFNFSKWTAKIVLFPKFEKLKIGFFNGSQARN